MSKRNEVVKEITDILQLADSLVGLVYLFKINRKTNKLIDKQREQNNAMINSLLAPMKKDTKNVIYLSSSLDRKIEEITKDSKTKRTLRKLEVEPTREISDISTTDLIKYEELKQKYLEENKKKGIVVDNLNDQFTDELLARSEAVIRKQNI